MLTDRQQQCLQGFIERKTAKEIGRDLGISHHAVEQHLKAARRKLGARDTREAASLYGGRVTTDKPYSGSPELLNETLCRLEGAYRVTEHNGESHVLRDSGGGNQGLAYGLNPLQTLGAILLVSFLLVAILALLIAAAQGVQILTS